MKNKAISWTVLIYALFLIALGYLGYHKSGSLMSLYSSLGFGFLLILCSLALFTHNKLGAYMAVILTLVLTAIFAYRYTVAQKPMPAVMAVVSAAVLLYLLAQFAKWKKA